MASSGTKTFVKVLKILLSIFLSFIFVTTAFALPIYYSVAGIFTPSTVVTVVQNIDFTKMIENSEEFTTVIEDLGIDKNAVNEIMKSDELGDFLENCTDTVMDAVINDPHNLESFDIAVLQDIVDNHVDDIAVVLQEELNVSIKKEDVHSTMNKLLQDNSDQIKQTLIDLAPSEEGSNPYHKAMSFIQTTLKWPVILLAILIEVLFLGLIYLLNKKKFGGFIWLAVDSGIVAILLTTALIILESNLISNIFAFAPNLLANVATTMLGTVTTKLLIAALVLGFIVIACIAAFILLRKYASKKAAALISDPILEQEATINADQSCPQSDEITE